MRDKQTKPFKLYFEYTDGVARKHWYEYPTEGCTVVYCTYDPALLKPIPIPSERDVTYSIRKRRLKTGVLLYTISVDISLGLYANGKIVSIGAVVANKSRNPIDRTIRELTASSGPEFWHTKWQYSFVAVNGITTEMDY